MKKVIKNAREMKTRDKMTLFIVIAAVAAMTLTGCRREDSISPYPYDCDGPWASDTCTFSMDKYNSLREVLDYFVGHDSTMIMHDGDTIKFYGWVYYHAPGEPVYSPVDDSFREIYTVESKFIRIVGNEDHHFYSADGFYGMELVWWSDGGFIEENPWFVQEFDSLLQKKWYITATLQASYSPGLIPSPCSKWTLRYEMIALDTLPPNNK